METLQHYRNRTEYMRQLLPNQESFQTNASLEYKVSREGKFITFVGDTTVFLLDKSVKKVLRSYQDILYDYSGEMLAEPIDPDTFHVTLHDLCNGQPSEALWEITKRNEIITKDILRELKDIEPDIIVLKPVSVFNMVNTSIVLGFEPGDEASCGYLMGGYQKLQKVEELNYPLTLHVTLAYFKPGEYSRQSIIQLNKALTQMKEELFAEMYLDKNRLVYQRFDDMNHYYSV